MDEGFCLAILLEMGVLSGAIAHSGGNRVE